MEGKRHKAICTANFKRESEELDNVMNYLVKREPFKLSSCKMKEKDTWSLLPDLLLWMIKDRLDIFDNMQLAAVCRDWSSVSARYPKKLQSVGDGFPWIMQLIEDYKNSAREFVGVVRRTYKIFKVDMPDFREACLLFSKQGWILFRREFLCEPTKRRSASFFIINVFTKSKIIMPDVEELHGALYRGSFSTLDGCPNCVVLVDPNCCFQITVRVARPGDKAWTQHSYLGQRMQFNGGLRPIIIRDDVFFFDPFGRMMTYNLSSHGWKEVQGSEKRSLTNYVMEHEGKIVKVERHDCRAPSFSFFSYNDIDASWKRLRIEDLKDTSWFLSRFSSYSTKDKGTKVYSLCPIHCGRNRVMISGHNLFVHDLMNASTQTLHVSCPIRSSATWVDIG